MSNRRRLPNRRLHVSFRFKHGDTWFTAGLGYFHHEGNEIGEVFINSDKADSDLDVMARDAAIATSFALQYGVDAATLYKSMTRNPDNSPSGPLGHVLEMIVQKEI